MPKPPLTVDEILDAIIDAQLIFERCVAEQPVIQSVEHLRLGAIEIADVLAQFYQTAAAHLITEEDADA